MYQLDPSSRVPMSAEALTEAAQRVATAYPSLYEHQRSGVAFLLSRGRAILADDMGLGKTRQAVIALREAAPAGPYLVICPAGVKLSWAREIHAVEPEADVHVLSGAVTPRDDVRWTVVNYDLLGRHHGALAAVPWAGVVVDEAHYIKNGSARAKHVLRLAGLDGAGHDPGAVYLLTGTPMTNRPRDLYNLLKAVRHPLATSFYSFARRYCGAFDNGYGLDTRGASNVEELASIVAGVMLRRTKDEALDLPPKTRTWQPVAIGSAAVRRDEARALDFLAKNPQPDGPSWGTFLGVLNHARHTLALAKVDATLECVRDRVEAGEKVVVFSSYSGVVERLTEELGDAAVSITGSTPSDERLGIADRFGSDPRVRVLVGNLVAAGVGLTLTAATHVVFNDLDWVPANHWQAEDRIYRIGQTRPAFVTYLVAEGTLDDYVAALLEQKARLVGVLEAEAADRATMVEAVVKAAVSGERPDWARLGVTQAERVAAASDGSTMGLLGDVLALLARADRGLGSVTAVEQVYEFPSRSRPGEVNTVRIVAGVATCSCTGFGYRGDCSHAREAARKAAAGPAKSTARAAGPSAGAAGRAS
jgi:SWI/SNF-related matrix-associated actin-dependent regulator of chromatin subfamily A-like protein 1